MSTRSRETKEDKGHKEGHKGHKEGHKGHKEGHKGHRRRRKHKQKSTSSGEELSPQLLALAEFERAFVAERQKLMGKTRRRRRLALLTNDGVALLDFLFEHLISMRSGVWDCIELVSAPDFGEIVRVEDAGILLITPTRTHVHVTRRPSEAKVIVLSHLLETLKFSHSAHLDTNKNTIILTNDDNGETFDLRNPMIMPTPLFLRSIRAERGLTHAQPEELLVSSHASISAGTMSAGRSGDSIAPELPPELPDPLKKKKGQLSRVQWRLSRNLNVEFEQ